MTGSGTAATSASGGGAEVVGEAAGRWREEARRGRRGWVEGAGELIIQGGCSLVFMDIKVVILLIIWKNIRV